MSDPLTRTSRQQFEPGLGFWTCLAFSLAVLLVQVWVYETGMDDWIDLERCQSIRHAVLPPPEFTIAHRHHKAEPPPAGRQWYRVCYTDAGGAATEARCALTLLPPESANAPTAVWLLGPANASHRALEVAARRLGLDGETVRRIEEAAAEGNTESASAWERSQYRQCRDRPLYSQPPEPDLDMSSVLLAWAWIWGIYACGRFMVGA